MRCGSREVIQAWPFAAALKKKMEEYNKQEPGMAMRAHTYMDRVSGPAEQG